MAIGPRLQQPVTTAEFTYYLEGTLTGNCHPILKGLFRWRLAKNRLRRIVFESQQIGCQVGDLFVPEQSVPIGHR